VGEGERGWVDVVVAMGVDVDVEGMVVVVRDVNRQINTPHGCSDAFVLSIRHVTRRSWTLPSWLGIESHRAPSAA